MRGTGWRSSPRRTATWPAGTRGRQDAEPEELFDYILKVAACEKDLAGRRVLVTAGATMEAVDPVRYLTNHSTGKMGCAVAKAAALRGAPGDFGGAHMEVPAPRFVKLVPVKSAAEMFEAVTSLSGDQDIIVKAAAVADYRPAEVADEKVKKKDGDLSIRLERTEDILAGWESTGGRGSSSAASPWRPRICWRIPGQSWGKSIWI